MPRMPGNSRDRCALRMVRLYKHACERMQVSFQSTLQTQDFVPITWAIGDGSLGHPSSAHSNCSNWYCFGRLSDAYFRHFSTRSLKLGMLYTSRDTTKLALGIQTHKQTALISQNLTESNSVPNGRSPYESRP
jgi:hypothetical protein